MLLTFFFIYYYMFCNFSNLMLLNYEKYYQLVSIIYIFSPLQINKQHLCIIHDVTD